MLEFITCGESHGKRLSAIIEGLPSGLRIDPEIINRDLHRRQQGFGRGARQKIETDKIEIFAGIYNGKTTGAPVGLAIHNKDMKIDELPQLLRPRPGHADLAGALKYGVGIREILERASARETAIRVAVGSVAKIFLMEFGIEAASHVVQIGKAKLKEEISFDEIVKGQDSSPETNCAAPNVAQAMIREIKRAIKEKDTLGGKFEIRVRSVPIGLGSHVHYKRKLDGRIAQGLMSMQTIKAVEFGIGVSAAEVCGSDAHDEIFYDPKRGYYHMTNRAGGITGGMSNGAEIRVQATMKPIATLAQPLRSVNMKTKAVEKADFERSDVCAVPAGSVIGEAIVAYEIADAFLEKFGGDSVAEIKRNYRGYLRAIEA